jgi:hypothetical protein
MLSNDLLHTVERPSFQLRLFSTIKYIHRVDNEITCSSCFYDLLRRYLMSKIVHARSGLNVPALDMENVVVLDSFNSLFALCFLY